MAKCPQLLFFGSLIFALATIGFVSISPCSMIGCVEEKHMTGKNTADHASAYATRDDGPGGLVDFWLKKTWKRIFELITTILGTANDINNTARHMIHRGHRILNSSSTINSSVRSLPSSASVRFMPFEHAPDAVRHWHAASGHWLRRWLRLSDLPSVTVSTANCTALFYRDKAERRKAVRFQQTHNKAVIPTATFIKDAFNCTRFVAGRRYTTSPVNRQEAEFPIAFSILMFKDVEQFERLLRAVYRPQNIYCIHVDNKSNDDIHAAVRMIARCFENIFVVDHPYAVHWGTFSVLEPELACMRLLLKRSRKWKYFINLTGQEFPLKTNWQIVRILKTFNGSNNMEGTIARRNKNRFKKATPAPHRITPAKGSVHIIAVRGFVEYAIHNKTAIEFLNWTKGVLVPDETFFTSLNHNPHLHAPGSYLGVPETDLKSYRFLARFKNWNRGPWPCGGKRKGTICIFGIGDLPLLASRPELFANKFHIDYQPLALDCIEELHYRRLRDEIIAGDVTEFDTSVYETQHFVRNHV